jgi:hypothetical protein
MRREHPALPAHARLGHPSWAQKWVWITPALQLLLIYYYKIMMLRFLTTVSARSTKTMCLVGGVVFLAGSVSLLLPFANIGGKTVSLWGLFLIYKWLTIPMLYALTVCGAFLGFARRLAYLMINAIIFTLTFLAFWFLDVTPAQSVIYPDQTTSYVAAVLFPIVSICVIVHLLAVAIIFGNAIVAGIKHHVQLS